MRSCTSRMRWRYVCSVGVVMIRTISPARRGCLTDLAVLARTAAEWFLLQPPEGGSKPACLSRERLLDSSGWGSTTASLRGPAVRLPSQGGLYSLETCHA